MVCKVCFRRFVALSLCLVLAFVSSVPVASASDPVTAATLTIAGGQLAGAGLTGEAALSLAGPVGAVVGVTLGALGLNAYVSKASQEAGKTRTRFVCDQLMIWAYQAGYTQEQLYSKIAQGLSVAADGTIQLGKEAAQTIEQFGNWLVTQDGLVVENPSASVPESYVSLAGLNCPVLDTYTWYGSSSGRAYTFSVYPSSATLVVLSDNIGIGSLTFISDNPFTITQLSPYSNTYSSVLRGDYYAYTLNQSDNLDRLEAFTGLPVYHGSYFSFLNSLDGSYDVVTGTGQAEDVFTGTPQDWAENKDLLNPSSHGVSIVLNPDLLNPIIDSLTAGQQATMGITDYLQALQDTWDHALDDVQTALGTITDTLTGIQEEIAIPDTAVQDPSITNPSIAPDTTPILNPSDVDPGTVVTGLSFDLTQIFPFCIPFDIYDMLATLSATPEAPVYHVHYVAPYNIVIDFTVDLSPWDSVATILRTVELLAFCIGLAYVTRSMFIRS